MISKVLSFFGVIYLLRLFLYIVIAAYMPRRKTGPTMSAQNRKWFAEANNDALRDAWFVLPEDSKPVFFELRRMDSGEVGGGLKAGTEEE